MNMKMLMMFGLLTVVAAASGFAQKQAPPEAGTPKDFKIPAGRSFTLDNGLAVTLIPYGKIPKTTFRFIVRTGGVHEPADRVWISSFVSDFLKEGTASLTSKQIAEAAAGMGGEISSASGDDTSGLSGTVLSEFAPDFLKLLAGMLQGPKFPNRNWPASRPIISGGSPWPNPSPALWPRSGSSMFYMAIILTAGCSRRRPRLKAIRSP